MKTLGLVGGTSWVSTVDYYRIINQGVNQALGGHQFARCILYSVNFGDIAALNEKGDREGIYQLIKDASEKVKHAGAEGLVLCANTLHMLADRLKEEIDIPIIHIAEATAKEINLEGLSRVGLLGTRFTMEEDFYISKLKAANIETMVPEKGDREYAHAVIFDELMKEIFKPESKSGCLEIMDKLRQKGAEGIILGCTEFPLIIKEDDLDLPLFDTTAIHARAAVDFALGR
jgi:aspartate racemase